MSGSRSVRMSRCGYGGVSIFLGVDMSRCRYLQDFNRKSSNITINIEPCIRQLVGFEEN